MAAEPQPRGPARRAAGIVASLVVAVAGVIAVLAFFNGRDASQVSSQAQRGPGQAFPDRGARHLKAGERAKVRFASSPPTSGPHVPVPVRRQGAAVSNDQLLHAVEAGNVVLLYGSASPPPALSAVAERAAGPFDPALVQGGQGVVLAPRPGTRGVVAVAWRHLLRAPSASDPRLRQFVDFWLGRGRGG